MTQNISPQAATAREQARAADGKFGAQPHDRASIDLGAGPTQAPSEVDAGRAFDEPARELARLSSQKYCARVLTDLARALREEPDVAFIAVREEFDDEGQSYPELVAMDSDYGRLDWDTGHESLEDHLGNFRSELDYETMLWHSDGVAQHAADDKGPEFARAWSVELLAAGPPREARVAEVRRQRKLIDDLERESKAEATGLAVEDMAEKARKTYPQAHSIALVEDQRYDEQYLTALDSEGNDLYEQDEVGRFHDLDSVASRYFLSHSDFENNLGGNSFRDFAVNSSRMTVLAVQDIDGEGQ